MFEDAPNGVEAGINVVMVVEQGTCTRGRSRWILGDIPEIN